MLEWTTSIGVRSMRSGTKWDHLTLREASMKKLTAILLTLCVSLAFIGCNDTASTTKKETKTTTEKSTTPPAKTP